MTEHVLEVHDEEHGGCPAHGDDPPRSCNICDGGLSNCLVCCGAEGSLPTECPGEKMSFERQEMVYKEQLDFRGGEWVGGPGVLPFAVPRLLEETQMDRSAHARDD